MASRERCRCEEDYGDLGDALLAIFAEVREACPALRRVLIPDDVWPAFQAWDRQPRDDAHHRSILLLAMDRGHLSRVTSAVHRYLISGNAPRADLREQYAQDLRERWMSYPNVLERHQRCRAFLGLLVELQCAEWLEAQGWTIDRLEALREGPDIVARSEGGIPTAFEAKFIGREDEDFVLVVNSLRGPAGRWVSPYVAANYLLFRAYEAAKQLVRTAAPRVALLVIDDQTWHAFQPQLDQNWIDWCEPRFFDGDRQWTEFLDRQRARYPDLEHDLRPALRAVAEIWIVRLSYPFDYNREHTFGMYDCAS